ncbi:MAG: multidrug effflux MFS transporter [Patescibacteria group bacterium]
MTETQTRSKRANFFLILMLGLLSTVTPFSIDMYLPAFPEIADDLQTSLANVSFSVSAYFIGFALGQIIYGPLLDRFGRKRPLYAGLSIYIAASIGCIFSTSIEALIIFRFIQALGACVSMVAATAMIHDFFPVKEGAKIFSLLILILGVSPLLAPTIGGFVVSAWGWQSVFYTLAIIVSLILTMIYFFLPEGHQPDPTVSLKLKPIFKNFLSILKEKQFYVYALSGSLAFAGLFVYVAGSPAIFMQEFGLSAKAYGGIFALLSVGFIGGSQLNIILNRKFSPQKIFKTCLTVEVITAILFLIGALNSWYGLAPTIGFLFVLLSCSGIAFPNAAAIALAPFSKNAGSASALLGFIQIGLGALLSSGVGLLESKGSLPTAAVIAIASALGLIILLGNKKTAKLET